MELFGKHREHLGTPRINLEKLLNKNHPSKRAKEDHGIFLAEVTRSMWSVSRCFWLNMRCHKELHFTPLNTIDEKSCCYFTTFIMAHSSAKCSQYIATEVRDQRNNFF